MEGEKSRYTFPWLVVAAQRTDGGLARLRRIYGAQIRVQRQGVYNLIHLDRPSRREQRRRLAGFLAEAPQRPEWLGAHDRDTGMDIIFLRGRRLGESE